MTRRRRALDHLDEDIRDHVERETRGNIDRGMSFEEARAAALRKFGNVARVLEDTRAVWQPVWLEQLLQDVRFGARMLRRNPAFTLVVVLTLALGIGLNTAVFSVVNAVLIRPLPYPHAERLVWLTVYNPLLKAEVVPGVDFLDWKAQAKSFDEMVAYGYVQQTLATAEGAGPHWIAQVTGDFWKLSGARPALGRLFIGGERDALIISDGLFERRFGRDPRVIGRVVTLSGRPVTITRVLPPDFRFVLPQALFGIGRLGSNSNDIEAYVLNPIAPGTEVRGGPMTIQLVAARLKPGVPLQNARAEIEGIQARIAREHAGASHILPKLRVLPLQEKLVGDARLALLILLGAVGFVLLIACANIASLLLARATSRRKEIAIRIAIGAGRARVVRQFVVENLVLGLLGGVAGLLLTRLTVAALMRLAPQAVPRLGEANLDGWVLLFALGITLAAVALFGFSPALSLWRSGVFDDLKQGGKTSSAGSAGLPLRRLLVAGEMALAIVLLTGAGLLTRSFWRMNAHPPGFDPECTLMVQMRLTGPRYREIPQQRVYFDELLSRIQDVPGVVAVGVINTVARGPISREGQIVKLSPQTPIGAYNIVSAGFGRVLGMRLVKGRWLTDHEPGHAVMINESYARRIFGNSDSIGRRIMVVGLAPAPKMTAATVVGVTGDLKYTRLDAGPEPEVYIPYLQSTKLPGATLMVRTAGDAARMASAIRTLVAEVDRTQPPGELKTLEQSLAESIVPRRFNLFLLGTFASTALLLALIGIYGVIAYSVSQRTHEIGVRAALGAPRGEIVRMVVRQGMTIVLAGIAAGLGAAFGLTRLMASLLFDVRPADPATFGAVALLLTVTALAASWIPARRAARVDPLVALRYE
ncbi:MAG: ABC transporter permease [Bryobacteraceae bacterium]